MKNLLDDLDPEELQRILRLMRPFSPAERAEKLRQFAAEGRIDGALLAALRDYFPSAPAPELGIGDRFGKYTITDLLGEGGMGKVYQAWDPDLTRNVAIKLIRPDLMDLSEEYRKRGLRGPEEMFREESAALASLQHAGIVSIYERGFAAGPGGGELPYCAMELVNGDPLRRYCEERRLGIDECLELMRQVCVAVGYAHSRKIVHRDLKPGNILIDHDGQPRVLDFGLAVVLDKCSPVDLLSLGVGSPGYLAPEQLSHEFGKVGYATDVYALGVILYELLGKRRPYHAEPSDPAFRATVTRSVPAKLGTVHRDLAGEIEEIVATCLTKHPSERYPNANVLQSVLTSCLEKRRLTRLARELGLRKDGPPPLPRPGPEPPPAPAPRNRRFDEEATVPYEREATPASHPATRAESAAPVSHRPGQVGSNPVEPVPREPATVPRSRTPIRNSTAPSPAAAAAMDPARSARMKVWIAVGSICVIGSGLILGNLIGNRGNPDLKAPFSIEALRGALLAGAAQYDGGRFREAAATFEGILAQDPDNELALLGRALSLRESGDARGAAADFARLEESMSPVTLRALELTRSAASGTEPEFSLAALVTGPSQETSPPPVAPAPPSNGATKATSETAPGVDSVNGAVETDYLRGIQQIQAGNTAEAILILNSVTDRAPNYKEANMYLAQAYFNLGQPEEAIRKYDEIIDANPLANNAYNFRAQVHLEMGNTEEAIADFSECLRLAPDYSIVYNFRGNAYLKAKEFEKAEADFTSLISHEPQDSVPHELRGRARIGRGKFAEALADLDNAASINSSDADIFYFRSKAKRGLGRETEAEADLTKALKLNPGVVGMHEDQ